MLNINLATLFPESCLAVLNTSILKKAAQTNVVSFNVYNIRDFAFNKHKKVDDVPYGGGVGMLLMAEPVFKCFEYVKEKLGTDLHVIYLTPTGQVFNQSKAFELSKMKKPIFFICGHYEGIDQRLIDEIVNEQISIGDYVISGGELASLVVIDSIVRLLPGTLSHSQCYENESHFSNFLEHPQYTRPRVWRQRKVPDVLISGHHSKIEDWCYKKSVSLTKQRRPDLLNS